MHRLRGTRRRDHRRRRHRARRRPAAHRPRRRDGALATGSRCGSWWTRAGRTPADARVRDDAAPTWIATAAEVGTGAATAGSTCRRCSRALLRARRPRTCSSRAARRWPARSCAAGLVDEVVAYVAPMLLGAGPAALADAGITTIAEAIDAGRRRRRRGSDPTCGSPRCPATEGGLTCSPASSRSSARSSRLDGPRATRRRLTVRGPTGHRRRPARRLDRGQRRLPDRRRRRRRRRSPPT